MLTRFSNWPEALATEIARVWAKPFVWGDNDCCLFAANCAVAITGSDIAASFRGYSTFEEASAILDRFDGVAGLAEAVARRYGLPEITPAKARRGDVCLLDAGKGETLGVCAGDRIVCPGFRGLVAYPLLQGIRAWGIG